MINAQQLVEEIRRELDPVEQEIRSHPYLDNLEAGSLRREELRLFAVFNQLVAGQTIFLRAQLSQSPRARPSGVGS